MNENTITEIFCDVDDFCTTLHSYCKSRLLAVEATKAAWFPKGIMSLSEVMTLMILFHLSGYHCQQIKGKEDKKG